jgi:Rrf2 family protein
MVTRCRDHRHRTSGGNSAKTCRNWRNMLSKTALLAIRALVVVGEEPRGTVISPRSIALRLNESPTYMAKVVRLLVRAGTLRAERGVLGGVFLSRSPNEITLLEIVEACQGTIRRSYCQHIDDLELVCAFHRAAVELERAVVGVLSRWTLAHMRESPTPTGLLPGAMHCVMTGAAATLTSSAESRQQKRNITR